MKKLVALLFLVTLLSSAIAQNFENKWQFGFLIGKTEYNGDLGSSMFKVKPFNAFGGLTLYRYLNSSFDLGLQGERGNMGYNNGTKDFFAKKFDVSLMLKYKFNNGYILKEDALVAPYLAAGTGVAWFSGLRTYTPGSDCVFPLGGGVRVNLTHDVALQYQILYNFTTGDRRDLVTGGSKDRFLAHSLGIILSFGGNKDSDKDGVADKLDKCPGTPLGVKVSADGCPLDSDGDGIADYLDKCPLTPAGVKVNNDGCPPDTDGDGIADYLDKCPTVKGLAALNGCPDRDGDGIADLEDKCPDVKGLAAFQGCPDTDGDGIIDSEDRCPTLKGPKELNGCPDSDGDGVADIDDKCPNVPGLKENKGCPAVAEATLKVFTQALTGITFETGKDIIKPASFPILNNVVSIMQNNPEYNIEINGHTDAVGDDAKNMDLSQRRADAVKKYLSDKGVAAERMTAKGFGETMPVADNNTSAGRAKNRRVEFKVNF